VIGRKVIEEHPVTLAEAKQILDKEMKGVEEPLYEQAITAEYLKKFAKTKPKTAVELREKLAQTNERIKEEVIVKIVDLLPRDEEDIRAIFAKERYALTKDELNNLLEVISGQE